MTAAAVPPDRFEYPLTQSTVEPPVVSVGDPVTESDPVASTEPFDTANACWGSTPTASPATTTATSNARRPRPGREGDCFIRGAPFRGGRAANPDNVKRRRSFRFDASTNEKPLL